ncbi:hypothetical protein, partial [Bradyrhizobium sp. UNPF46]|uniref:hypothetical protein n=1 Tax=Bradyrhizobium sp. UNPF46 TaxID=1141168 RepID=UPI001AEE05C9
VDTGSREENASKQESRASVLIQSEPKMLEREPHAPFKTGEIGFWLPSSPGRIRVFAWRRDRSGTVR